ncbi:hypothetical protein BJV74DRAFT_799177 [Russula compacta]|nr:hypothetical protein BJV74DRAFT_799177 [Russula compacta]
MSVAGRGHERAPTCVPCAACPTVSAVRSWAIRFAFAEFPRFSGDGKNLDVRTVDELQDKSSWSSWGDCQQCRGQELGGVRGGHEGDEAMRVSAYLGTSVRPVARRRCQSTKAPAILSPVTSSRAANTPSAVAATCSWGKAPKADIVRGAHRPHGHDLAGATALLASLALLAHNQLRVPLGRLTVTICSLTLRVRTCSTSSLNCVFPTADVYAPSVLLLHYTLNTKCRRRTPHGLRGDAAAGSIPFSFAAFPQICSIWTLDLVYGASKEAGFLADAQRLLKLLHGQQETPPPHATRSAPRRRSRHHPSFVAFPRQPANGGEGENLRTWTVDELQICVMGVVGLVLLARVIVPTDVLHELDAKD